MGLLECASGAAVWRGYDYYKEKKIKTLEEIGDNIYSATVTGSSNERYSVELHVGHPRKSKCNCPHADGKRVICKHIVAAYFTAFPEEAEKFYTEAMAYQSVSISLLHTLPHFPRRRRSSIQKQWRINL